MEVYWDTGFGGGIELRSSTPKPTPWFVPSRTIPPTQNKILKYHPFHNICHLRRTVYQILLPKWAWALYFTFGMKRIAIIISTYFLLWLQVSGQSFEVGVEPMDWVPSIGLQSFAWAQQDGYWLLVGGRLDGLHRRQPFASFDIAGHNKQLMVLQPSTGKIWTAALTELTTPIQDQLSATNMAFITEGEYLYIAGGYGYSATEKNHTTYPNLLALQVKKVIEAIKTGSTLIPHIRQISDPKFAVTGGALEKLDNHFYLVGGQRFVGRYNPHGPDHGPGFVQEYTNAIRRFTIEDNDEKLMVTHLTETIDTANLHRRDFNVVPQIMPDGQQGLTAFSGVFRRDADLPYLSSVNITGKGHAVQAGFEQIYNHYHCANIPLYSANANEMHTVFFGGISQYYDSAGVLMKDDDVPFVRTIARVTRNASGLMKEFKLPLEMPALLGAGAEFIPLENLPHYANDVIKMDELPKGTTLIGYIFGGISSTAPNVFWTNNGTQSSANSTVYKVVIIKK